MPKHPNVWIVDLSKTEGISECDVIDMEVHICPDAQIKRTFLLRETGTTNPVFRRDNFVKGKTVPGSTTVFNTKEAALEEFNRVKPYIDQSQLTIKDPVMPEPNKESIMNQVVWILDSSVPEGIREGEVMKYENGEYVLRCQRCGAFYLLLKEEKDVYLDKDEAITVAQSYKVKSSNQKVIPMSSDHHDEFTFVEPSVTPILESDLQRKVERCYRICYKSEKHMKETPDAFLKNLIHHTTGNHHWSPLEHARIEMQIGGVLAGTLSAWEEWRGTRFLQFGCTPHVMDCGIFRLIESENEDIYGVCGNFRTLLEFITFEPGEDEGGIMACQYVLANALSKHYPAIFTQELVDRLKAKVDAHEEHIPFKYFDVTCKVVGEAHDYRTYHIVTTRDILQELARHRAMSFSVESTRYCNYGKKGVVFTAPRPYPWTDELLKQTEKGSTDPEFYLRSSEAYAYFSVAAEAACLYTDLIEKGVKPQVARMLLPGALKTELMMTATIKQWEAFLKLRDDDAAHPQIRILAQMIKKDLNDNVYIHGSN